MARFKIFDVKEKDIGSTPIKKKTSGGKSTGLRGSLFGGDVSDFKQLKKNLNITEKAFKHALAAAIFDESVKIMDKSQKLVPVDKTDLKRSAEVKPPKTLKRPTSSLSYNTQYALRQHEEHSSKSKYLERPMLQRTNNMHRRLREGIKKHVTAGTKISSLKIKRYG